MMPREEMLLRLGFYCGRAARDLGDFSYAARTIGRGREITITEYEEISSEIHARLLAAGKIRPDEDPYESR